MKITDPILTKVTEMMMSKVPKQLNHAVDEVVVAGNKIINSDKTRKMVMQQLKKPGDPAANLGEGIAKLVSIVWKHSNGQLPIKAVIPAGVVLLCQSIQFLADAGMVQISNEFVQAATQDFASTMLQLMGVTPDKLGGMMSKVAQQGGQQQGGQQQPQPAAQPAQQPGGIIAGAQGA